MIYKYARSSPRNYPINLGLVFYSNLAYMILFSFFADKFGAIVLSPNMLKRVIILLFVNYFMFDLDLRKSKLIYRNPFKHKGSGAFSGVKGTGTHISK